MKRVFLDTPCFFASFVFDSPTENPLQQNGSKGHSPASEVGNGRFSNHALEELGERSPRHPGVTCQVFERPHVSGPLVHTGERCSEEPGMRIRYDVLKEFADLAAQGRFSTPIARTSALDERKTALSVSEGQQARGKLILLP